MIKAFLSNTCLIVYLIISRRIIIIQNREMFQHSGAATTEDAANVDFTAVWVRGGRAFNYYFKIFFFSECCNYFCSFSLFFGRNCTTECCRFTIISPFVVHTCITFYAFWSDDPASRTAFKCCFRRFRFFSRNLSNVFCRPNGGFTLGLTIIYRSIFGGFTFSSGFCRFTKITRFSRFWFDYGGGFGERYIHLIGFTTFINQYASLTIRVNQI